MPTVALSLRQPWAWMVVNGGKGIENRKWNTARRGDFLIHAAKGMTRKEYFAALEFARHVAPELDVPPMADLMYGGIIGRARIVDVHPPCAAGECTHPWHMAGQFGFVLAEVQPLLFHPLVGSLGFFKVAPEVLAQLGAST